MAEQMMAPPRDSALNTWVALQQGLLLCLFPAGVMLFTSLLALSMKVPVVVAAAMQHLAAGIVLSAVAVELVPQILAAPNDLATSAGMTLGFVAGIAFFLALSKFCGHDGDDDDDDAGHGEEEEDSSRKRRSKGDSSLVTRYRSVSDPCAANAAESSAWSPRAPKLNIMRSALAAPAVHAAPAVVVAPHAAAPPAFPVVLTVAVATDALVDGLLIGISATSGAQAGIVITGALAIEMGFLGLTFASCAEPHSKRRPIAAAAR